MKKIRIANDFALLIIWYYPSAQTLLFLPVIQVADTGIYLIFIMEIVLIYAPRICFSLYNLQIFLHLDPSVRYLNDREKRHLDNKRRTTWMIGKSGSDIAFKTQSSCSSVSATRMTSSTIQDVNYNKT